MPFFPHFPVSTYSNHRNPADDLFTLLDTLPSALSCALPSPITTTTTARRSFSPKFDVHETNEAYVLEGELPGLADKNNKDNLSIEFTDDHTLMVRGKIQRSSEERGYIDENGRMKRRKIESSEKKEGEATTTKNNAENADEAWESVSANGEGGNASASASASAPTTEPPPSPAPPSASEDANGEGRDDESLKKKPKSKSRYWVSERSTGKFSRSFSFPRGEIDVEKVTANLEHGILRLVVPKKEKAPARKIVVE